MKKTIETYKGSEHNQNLKKQARIRNYELIDKSDSKAINLKHRNTHFTAIRIVKTGKKMFLNLLDFIFSNL